MVRFFKMFLLTRLISLVITADSLGIQNKNESYLKLQIKVLQIIQDFYVPKTEVVNIVWSTGSQSDFKKELPEKILKFKYVTIMLESPTALKSQRRRFCNIFVIEKFQDFMEIIEEMSPKLFYSRGFYTIVLTTEISNETQRIFEFLWRKEIFFYDSKDAVTTLGFN